MNLLQLSVHVLPGHRIERVERFVHQKDLGAFAKARQIAAARLHAARKLAWILSLETFEPDHLRKRIARASYSARGRFAELREILIKAHKEAADDDRPI